MPDTYSVNLQQLIRVCLNDPSAREQIDAAIEAGPLPVRTPCGVVSAGGDKRWQIFLRTDRDQEPGNAGFLVRDDDGNLTGRLREAVAKAAHDASTMSAEEMAKQMGISQEQLAEHLKKPE